MFDSKKFRRRKKEDAWFFSMKMRIMTISDVNKKEKGIVHNTEKWNRKDNNKKQNETESKKSYRIWFANKFHN